MADRRLEVKSNRHGAFDLLTTTANLGVNLCVEGAKPPGVLLDYLLQGSGANQHASTWMVHCTTTCAVSNHTSKSICSVLRGLVPNGIAIKSSSFLPKWYI
jgi:hypothetical protein